jgi:hypothetical protein
MVSGQVGPIVNHQNPGDALFDNVVLIVGIKVITVQYDPVRINFLYRCHRLFEILFMGTRPADRDEGNPRRLKPPSKGVVLP